MKPSHILPLVVSSAAAIFASTSPAHALDFNWTLSTDNGTFGGTITGLQDNSINAASQFSVTLTNYSGGTLNVPLGQYQYNYGNSAGLSVQNGQIVDTSGGVGYWYGFLTTNFNDALVFNALVFNGSSNSYGHVTGFGTGVYNTPQSDTGGTIIFTAAGTTAVPFDIPGGATIPSVGTLLALGAMRKAKKNLAVKGNRS
jgi:hypothetical protein